jgi:hypothetical protein
MLAKNWRLCTQLAASAKFECDWPPVACYFCMRLAASRMQSRQSFASTLREQLFEIKNEDAI